MPPPPSRDYEQELLELLEEMAAPDRSISTTRNELGKRLGVSPNIVVGLLRTLEARGDATSVTRADVTTIVLRAAETDDEALTTPMPAVV